MNNSNYCVGCLFNGTVDGNESECCNCHKKDAAIIASIEKNKAAVKMLDYVDNLLPDTKQYDTIRQDKKKARRMQRRIADKKYSKKAPKNLAITTAKLNRLSVGSSSDDFEVANKKCFNAAKKAVYSYHTSIALAFPEIPKGSSFGSNMDTLYLTISKWKNAKDVSPEMETACDDALRILKMANSDYDVNLVGLHREGNILHLTIGFHDKISMLDFIHKKAV